ncbi:class I SAM-dependent methyltransferase [Caulobacter endophyticus]|uniref:class I SAM-dependent methyltransferase n=1 Tax=Caulobacter endophyticus TaxID=2172652 RepID=UPI00240FD251|nr:class I SAM-dependent methyltransferase [Caulobacter endophyticus]MDG2527286.1 class I SAM-dependent methyltransferase [Caulobacter endophyticus]
MKDLDGDQASQDRQATVFDVEACYRTFLGRDCETPETAKAHLADAPSVWALVDRFRASAEARRYRIHAAAQDICQDQDGRGVDLTLDEAQAQALSAQVEAVWSRYGREEAFFSVLTNPRYLSSALRDEHIEEFYATGATEVERFIEACRRNGVEPHPAWSVLELGCGVARMGEAFAQRFSTYAGVDISAGHLALARDRLRDRGVRNATLRLLPDFLAADDGYDVFFSVIVLQHNPPPIIHKLLDISLRRLNPGGYASFQVPCFLYGYQFETSRYLAEADRPEIMEMHALPQRHVFDLLARHGLHPIEVVPDGRIGSIGVSYSFLARKAG